MAVAAGASEAEVLVRIGSAFSATVRAGAVERLLQAGFRKLGLRIFAKSRSALSATSDFSPGTLSDLVARTLEMARAAGEDPAIGLPGGECYSNPDPALHLSFPGAASMPPESRIDLARRCEAAALTFDPQITNSEGGSFENSSIHNVYANSLGVLKAYEKSLCSLSATALAEQDGRKQRDYWQARALDACGLPPPEMVGREAARRTLRRLGASRLTTREVPVVFDPLAAASLLGHIAEAVSGTALVRQASFLLNRIGHRIASPLVTIIDDGLLPQGLGSRQFDSEGLPSRTTTVVREGVLENYLLDSYAARRLGMSPTANSDREPDGAPSSGPSNFYLRPGDLTPGEIIASVRQGLYVTELLGFGVNIVSANYSQGAAGLWIENGRLGPPVEEITIAGNLREMLLNITAVGDDLQPLAEIFAPTILISRMTVSGSQP